MKLYAHPLSTTSRAVLMFAAEHHMALDLETVDIFSGAHLTDAYASINPNRAVPVLVDGDLVLPECSAILKYLADRVGSPTYPQAAKDRARTNAAMDWFNTGFARDFAYGLVYPLAYPGHHGLPEPRARALAVEQARARSERWLTVLDQAMLGPQHDFVCGGGPTLADYLGAAYVTAGELIGFDFTRWPNVERWLACMAWRPALREPFAAFRAFAIGVRSRVAAAEAA